MRGVKGLHVRWDDSRVVTESLESLGRVNVTIPDLTSTQLTGIRITARAGDSCWMDGGDGGMYGLVRWTENP